jgi:hypothetical protein
MWRKKGPSSWLEDIIKTKLKIVSKAKNFIEPAKEDEEVIYNVWLQFWSFKFGANGHFTQAGIGSSRKLWGRGLSLF